MDKSLVLSVHMCFNVDLGLPDLSSSDFPGMEPWTLETYDKNNNKKKISMIELAKLQEHFGKQH